MNARWGLRERRFDANQQVGAERVDHLGHEARMSGGVGVEAEAEDPVRVEQAADTHGAGLRRGFGEGEILFAEQRVDREAFDEVACG